MQERPIVWLGSTLEDVRKFPEATRSRLGYQLWRVQTGLLPSGWRPMPTVGPGVIEIRVHDPLEHRVLYVNRWHTGVYVLHAFEKRTPKTPRAALDLARIRLREVPPR